MKSCNLIESNKSKVYIIKYSPLVSVFFFDRNGLFEFDRKKTRTLILLKITISLRFFYRKKLFEFDRKKLFEFDRNKLFEFDRNIKKKTDTSGESLLLLRTHFEDNIQSWAAKNGGTQPWVCHFLYSFWARKWWNPA